MSEIFDPIASAAVSLAAHREPQFVFTDEVDVAREKLARFRERTGRRGPNILVILMDDVGWGDFGCYGGGVAVGAPTRQPRAAPGSPGQPRQEKGWHGASPRPTNP